MIGCCGRLVASGPRFSFRDYHVTSATIDVDDVRVSRARANTFRSAVAPPRSTVKVDFSFPAAAEWDESEEPLAWESARHIKEEEFTRAMALGLFDYLRKSRSRGFVVSLSGGADSAAVASLCGLAVRLVWADVGREGVSEKLAPLGESITQLVQAAQGPTDLVYQLLTCVYQATRNSSATTQEAAAAVAKGLGARFLNLDVDGLVQDYVDLVSATLQRPLQWETDDVALQNIQARVRGPSVWMLANLQGALLLATSNRSEAAVGYATMDGDTCGGLSPIAGIDKAFLRRWLRWMETVGPTGCGAFKELALVNRQAPTAELRPLDQRQTDEADLMPYDLLDAIERAAIRDKKTPLECFLLMRRQFPGYSISQLGTWVERFFRLWCRNQWKRERYAPSFHVDDENLDPKTWCRFPILSGGYERELRQLQEYLERLTQTTGHPQDDKRPQTEAT